MDAVRLIFSATAATTQGLRSTLVQVTLESDPEWGDDYVVTSQTAGSGTVRLYQGDAREAAAEAVERLLEDHRRQATCASTPLAGVILTPITDAVITVDELR